MSRTQRVKIFSAVIVLLIGGVTLYRPVQVKADDCSTVTDANYDYCLKYLQDLQNQADSSKKKAEQKQNEASNLQDVISGLDGSISDIQSKIANSEAQISITNQIIANLSTDISQSQQQLDDLTAKLKNAYVNLYQISRTSPLELMLQTGSVNGAVTLTENIQSIQDSLNKDIDKSNLMIADLNAKKSQSEQQKASLEKLNKDLSTTNFNLTQQKKQKDYLLDVTQGDQSRYQALMDQYKKEAETVSDQIIDYLNRFGSGAHGGGNDYGYRNAYAGYFNASYSDPGFCDGFDGRGYCIRQCVSYAAYRWATLGYSFNMAGNANNWDDAARARGYSVTNYPAVHSIAVWNAGSWGHVAVVESVNTANNTFLISQYNVPVNGQWGLFSTDTKVIGESAYGLGVPVFILPR